MAVRRQVKRKRTKMSIRRAVERIKRYQPKNKEGFQALGFTLQHLGGGVFREVYAIKQAPLVVKFAYDNDPDGDNVKHNRDEISRIKRLYKHKWFRRYLPKIHYYDHANGILVMQKYENDHDDDFDYDLEVWRLLEKAITKATGVKMRDIHDDNIHVDANGKLKFIDLGL